MLVGFAFGDDNPRSVTYLRWEFCSSELKIPATILILLVVRFEGKFTDSLAQLQLRPLTPGLGDFVRHSNGNGPNLPQPERDAMAWGSLGELV